MKTRLKHLLLYSAFFMLCAAPSISFDAMFPASKPLPEHIKTIAIIDRSGRENRIANILEGGLSGEGIGQDKEASRVLTEGIMNQLNGAGKYRAVKTNLEMVSDEEPGQFSGILSYARIKEICEQHNADAVLSIEYFDTDHVGDQLHANTGIRIYDSRNGEIIDEYRFTNSMNIARRNDDLINLVSNYLNSDAVQSLSYEAGIIYGQRISPYWLRVERKYYKKAKRNKDLAMGARMMEVNDWDNAIKAFEAALSSGKRKTLGRAHHNLAVVYEITGNHQAARDHAQKAWTNYKNKESKEYAAILSRRLSEIERLKQQGE